MNRWLALVRLWAYVFCSLLLLAVASCTPDPTTFAGQVVELQSRKPVAGATVQADT